MLVCEIPNITMNFRSARVQANLPNLPRSNWKRLLGTKWRLTTVEGRFRRKGIRTVRDTPVAGYSKPGINTTHRAAYCPPIAISQFLLVPSVTRFEWSCWRCGQLWAFLGMGLLGARLHRDCNAIGDATKISPRDPSTCAHNPILSLLIAQVIPSRQIYVVIDNPSLMPSTSCLATSLYLWNHVRADYNVSHSEN